MATEDLTPENEERPLKELFANLTQNLQILFRKEVELAKLELSDQARQAAKAGALFGAAAVVGLLGAVLVSFAAAWGLAEGIPTWLAFLAVGLLYLVVAGLVLLAARKRVASLKPVPQQTMQTLKEDVEVAKSSISRGAGTDSQPAWGRS